MTGTTRDLILRFTWALLLTFVLTATGAAAAQAAWEVQLGTAVQHAEFSLGSDEHESAQRHLGHVLNCIAGEAGDGFDGAWGHPCGGQGEGLLADLAEHPRHADVAAVLNAAHGLGLHGVQSDSLGAVHAAAAAVRALLEVVSAFGD